MLLMLIYTPYQIIGNTCINYVFMRVRQYIYIILHCTSPQEIATPVCGLVRNDPKRLVLSLFQWFFLIW